MSGAAFTQMLVFAVAGVDGPAPPAIKVLHAIARRPAAVREQEHHIEGRALRFDDEV